MQAHLCDSAWLERADTAAAQEVGAIFHPKPKAYLSFIEEQVGCPVQIVSVGPRRDQTILLDPGFKIG
jgi:adenylosuccinate synthase